MWSPILTCSTVSGPIWTDGAVTPPAKFVHDEDGRRGMAVSSLVSGGCIVSGARIRRSVLFTGFGSILLLDRERGDFALCRYARAARLTNVVIDRGVKFLRASWLGRI